MVISSRRSLAGVGEAGQASGAPRMSRIALSVCSPAPGHLLSTWGAVKRDRLRGNVAMITVLGSPRSCCDGLTRRETLKAGALSLLGGFFTQANLLALERGRLPGDRPGKAKSVVLLYLQGGPPTQDMFDLKPDAPAGIRSEF